MLSVNLVAGGARKGPAFDSQNIAISSTLLHSNSQYQGVIDDAQLYLDMNSLNGL